MPKNAMQRFSEFVSRAILPHAVGERPSIPDCWSVSSNVSDMAAIDPLFRLSRRHFLRACAVTAAAWDLADCRPATATAGGGLPRRQIIDSVRSPDDRGGTLVAPDRKLRSDEFNIVGVFDIDWLNDPRFGRLLDNMAASPGAFKTVRVFGALNSGDKENVAPVGSGFVWPRVSDPIDLSATLEALSALVDRGLIPFVVLSFFPHAVSPFPTQPPHSYQAWQQLVRTFFDRLADRFGASSLGDWWFEVWNEPNMPPFWRGTFEQYLDLYKVTSDAAVASGYSPRLGGPVIYYTPSEGRSLIERFLAFLAREPGVKCDFISLHRKGIAVSEEAEPDLARLVEAAEATAQAMLRLIPDRARGMWIVNDEADMKVGFDIPYEPRMSEAFPAWLGGLMITHDALSLKYGSHGLRFMAASDNANQQLIRNPFDGRRSIMTMVSSSFRDLVKLPVYNFYELLRFMSGNHGVTLHGSEIFFPHSDLFHVVTTDQSQIGALFTRYASSDSAPRDLQIDYVIQNIPWSRANIVRFRIDATHSNAFTAAGRELSIPIPNSEQAQRIRRSQELRADFVRSGVTVVGHEFHDSLELAPFATVLYWITPFSAEPLAAPKWLEATVEDGNVILRWTPNREAPFYSYEVYRKESDARGVLISPEPLRSAMLVDTAPLPGRTYVYSVRALSASGVPSLWSTSPPVSI